MRIAKIEMFQIDLPFSGGVYRLSGGREYTSFDATIVRLTTDCGIEGWGESTPFGSTYIAAHAAGARAGIALLAPHLLGQDPRAITALNAAMDNLLVGHNHAKAALDVACWDIFGKATNMPAYTLLGGSVNDDLALISSIHAGTPEDMAKRVADFRSRGYLGHSIKIGHTDAEGGPIRDAECVAACLADRQPGELFLCDANGGMTPEMVLRFLALLPAASDIILEAPCSSWAETMSLRQRCTVPLMLDELIIEPQDIITAIRQDAADGIGLKITKAGGLTKARQARDICSAAGLVMSVQDTVGSDIAMAAVAHLAQTVSPKLLRCVLDTRSMVSQQTAEWDAKFEGKGLRLGTSPGLGLTVDAKLFGTPVGVWD